MVLWIIIVTVWPSKAVRSRLRRIGSPDLTLKVYKHDTYQPPNYMKALDRQKQPARGPLSVVSTSAERVVA